jgi:type IV pilus assembly protein PilQ
MNNIKKLPVLFFLVICWRGQAQGDEVFQQRLAIIKQQLELMSDSTVTGLNETANFSVSNLPVQSFLRSVAESHRLNIQIDPSLNFSLTNNFTNVLVKDLIYFICEEYQTDIRFTNTIMSFYKYQPPRAPEKPIVIKKLNITYNDTNGLITFDLSNDSLRSVVKEITRLTNKNVITSGGLDVENKLVRGLLKTFLSKMRWINSRT